MRFTIYQESRQGGRSNNEDRTTYCYSREALLMVVADGMGGHHYGEIAAQIAVQTLADNFQREARPTLVDPFRFLQKGMTNAHHAILDFAERHRLADAPRTTCVACLVQDNVAYWVHAGDSRLYVLRDGRVLTRTRDHSTVQAMIDDGQITAAEAQHHPLRNRIYSCLGGLQSPQFDFSRKTPLLAGDVLLLCSDGVWGPLDDLRFVTALHDADVIQAVPPLLDEAERAGGSNADNLSLIALCWGENYGEEAAPGIETGTMPFDAHSTQMLEFERSHAPQPELTDADIERAIDEIRNAIRKNSP